MSSQSHHNRELRRLTLNIPVELHDELMDVAFEEMCSSAAVVRRALQLHLKRRREAMAPR